VGPSGDKQQKQSGQINLGVKKIEVTIKRPCFKAPMGKPGLPPFVLPGFLHESEHTNVEIYTYEL
jgi:hypothetical protein